MRSTLTVRCSVARAWTSLWIVWLQYFGRGLRKYGDKKLPVFDYIGNHRSFLLKARTLLDLTAGSDRGLYAALERAQERGPRLAAGLRSRL